MRLIPAVCRPSGGGTRRGFFSALRCFLFWFFVSSLNCVSYGEPDVRPAGRPFGRVRGLMRCGDRLRSGLLRVG